MNSQEVSVAMQAASCVDIKATKGHTFPDVTMNGYNTFPLIDSILRKGHYTFLTSAHRLEVPRDWVRVFSGGNGYNAYTNYLRLMLAGEVDAKSVTSFKPKTGDVITKELEGLTREVGEAARIIVGPHAHPRRMFHGIGKKGGEDATFHFSSPYQEAIAFEEQVAQTVDPDDLLIADCINELMSNRTIVVPSSCFFERISQICVGDEGNYSRMENVVLAFNDDEAVEKLHIPRSQIPSGIDRMDCGNAGRILSHFCQKFIPENEQRSQDIQLLFSFETRDEGSFAVYDTPEGRKIVYLPLDFDRSAEIGKTFQDDTIVRPEWAGKAGAGRGDARAIAKEMGNVFYQRHGGSVELALKSAMLCAESASAGMHHSLHSNYAQHDTEDLKRVLIDAPIEQARSDFRIRIFDFDLSTN